MNAKRDADRLSSMLSVDIQQVSKTDWRVSASADEVLGFVEQLAPHRFEVLWLSEPVRWGYTETFTDAITAVAGADAPISEITLERHDTTRGTDLRFESASMTPPPMAVRSHHRATWVTSAG